MASHPKPEPQPPSAASFSSRKASISIRNDIADTQARIPPLPNNVDRNNLATITSTLYNVIGQDKQSDAPLKVGIVGAGVAGLFTAMLFDWMRDTYGLEIDYEILEANGEDRLGGRLYTYSFPPLENDTRKYNNHDYYDVGAMRFPDTDVMKRTFDLFNWLDMRPNVQEVPGKKRGSLVPYYYLGENAPLQYNDVQIVPTDKDTITAKTFKITGLRPEIASQKPGDLVGEHINVFVEMMKTNPQAGWTLLMRLGDKYSCRQFLSEYALYDHNTIEWCETFNSGNRWYDQALSEAVCEELDFDSKANWYCVEGGSQIIARRMAEKIEKARSKNPIEFHKKVTKLERIIELTESGPSETTPEKKMLNEFFNTKVDVSVRGEAKPRRYDAVFNTATLGAMRQMDLSGLNLNWGTKHAIRSLGYGASCKVGIRFKYMWWIKDLKIIGGVGKTDMPIQYCVYPSYNIYDDAKAPGVLLVAYNWSQEAQRLGSLISKNSPADEAELKELLFHNLAKLHSKTGDQASYDEMYKIISESYIDHYAYDWYGHGNFSGAFAYFGPGQFKNMYPNLTCSDGRHIIVGEAASAHHAWVVGALESAVRGVYQFLFSYSWRSEKINEVLQAYHEDKVPGPFGPLPPEFERSTDVSLVTDNKKEPAPPNAVNQLSYKGEWARQMVIFEAIRQLQGKETLVPEKIEEGGLLKPITDATNWAKKAVSATA